LTTTDPPISVLVDPAHPPTHGWTKRGFPVHALVHDHMPTGTAYQRLNKRLAILLTNSVGTMTCFWMFCVLSLCALPATLVAAHVIPASIGFIAATGFILTITWISQNFIQLVLLPALMVGQNLQNIAADARAAKTFEDVESAKADLTTALDLLDCETRGGIGTLNDKIDRLIKKIDA